MGMPRAPDKVVPLTINVVMLSRSVLEAKHLNLAKGQFPGALRALNVTKRRACNNLKP
jgi:hypothetical protein